MDGAGVMLISLGHDIQLIEELKERELLEPDLLFSQSEVNNIKTAKCSATRLAGYFSAKEALFKAINLPFQWYWTDAEIIYNLNGRPYFKFAKKITHYLKKKAICTELSISHSGNYASSVVIVYYKNS